MFDLVIERANIIDGTGSPWFKASVAINADRIVGFVAPGTQESHRTLNGEGYFLAPGLVDVHTHDDIAMLREPARLEKIAQGVTTIVTGNCSFSAFPYLDSDNSKIQEHLGSLLGRIEDGELFADFSSYRRALEGRIGPNVVALVGHGPLRLAVLGYQTAAASSEQLDRMQGLLSFQLSQGAAGLSLGLVYPPSSWANNDELLALATVVKQHDKILSAHIRNYDNDVEVAIEEFLDLLRVTGAKGLLSHLQVCGSANWGKMNLLLDRLEAARAEGIDVACDMYPYTAGSSTILQLLPPSAQDGGIDGTVEKLSDPIARSRIKDIVSGSITDSLDWHSKVAQIGWHNIRVGGVEAPGMKKYEGRFIAEAAENENREPFDLAAELIACDCGQTNIIMFQQDEGDLKKVLRHRLHMTGSDSIPRNGGLPHPRGAGAFSRLLRKGFEPGGTPIEEIVRRMTSLPAQRFALWERGIVRPGMVADLVLFGPDVNDRATYDHPRLPPDGIKTVIIGGSVAVEEGRFTESFLGKVL